MNWWSYVTLIVPVRFFWDSVLLYNNTLGKMVAILFAIFFCNQARFLLCDEYKFCKKSHLFTCSLGALQTDIRKCDLSCGRSLETNVAVLKSRIPSLMTNNSLLVWPECAVTGCYSGWYGAMSSASATACVIYATIRHIACPADVRSAT